VHALLTLVGRIRRIPRRWHLPTACTHHLARAPQAVHTTVMPPPPGRLYGVRLMGQTPIYDQLRGERINADIPATAAVPQLLDHPGRHHLLAVAPGPAAVFGPRRPGTDLNENRHHPLGTYPAGHPAIHARQAPAHAASSSPALPAANDSAGQGAATGNHGGHRAEGDGPRQVQHTEPRPATPAVAQFPWFNVDHDAGYSSSGGR
jgi:hypothetical protein